MTKIVLVATMPRSGSTLLLNILAQNPAFHCTPTNGLADFISATRDHWKDFKEFNNQGYDVVQPRVESALKHMLRGFYEQEFNNPEKKVIFDKSRTWVSLIPLYEMLFDEKAKILCTLRDLKDVAASWEKIYQSNPMQPQGNMRGTTIRDRVDKTLSKDHIVGGMVWALREAKHQKQLDRYHFIQFEHFTKHPLETLKNIHEWLDIEWYKKYDPNNVEQVTFEDDQRDGFPLHKIRKEIKPVWPPAHKGVIPEEICKEIDNQFEDINMLATGDFSLDDKNQRAKQLFEDKKYKEAAQLATEILEETDERGAVFNAAKALNYSGDPEKAEKLMRKIYKQDTSDFSSTLDLSLFCHMQGKHTEAKKLLSSLPQDNPRVRFNLGWYELNAGNLNKGLGNLASGREISAWGNSNLKVPGPQYNGEDLNGKTIALIGEAGLGDEIICCRFIKTIQERGGTPIWIGNKKINPLVRQSFDISVIDYPPQETINYHYWIPAMDAGYVLGLEYDSLSNEPYLKIDADEIEKHAKMLREHQLVRRDIHRYGRTSIKVGVRWKGNPKFEHEQMRSYPINEFAEMLKPLEKKITFFSIQRDEGTELTPNSFIDLKTEMETWINTAAIMKNMDLVITSCTSIAHLSGALGIPTWVVVPIAPYYIWAHKGDKSLWYKSAKLYRQKDFYSWKEPCEEIVKDLENLIEELL